MKAVLFDLYDTVLNDDFFDYNQGIEYLHDRYFSEECTLDDFVTFSMSFIPLYQDRAVSNKEISFLRDQYRVYCQQLEYTPSIKEDDLDYEIMTQMQKEVLLPEVKDTLMYLNDKGIKLYLITNSIFKASSHKKLLKEFNLDTIFQDLYSSADFGMRKPDKSFFDYATRNILLDNPGMIKDDIITVGNDYYSDVQGGLNAGLKAVWYNPDNLKSEDNSGITSINNFTLIKDLASNDKY